MDGSGTWRERFTWRRWRAAPEPEQQETESLAQGEPRQPHLKRLLSHGIPQWTEEPEHCDGCGRELLPGEPALLLQRSDELAIACPLCAERLLDQGYLRVTLDGESDAGEEGPSQSRG